MRTRTYVLIVKEKKAPFVVRLPPLIRFLYPGRLVLPVLLQPNLNGINNVLSFYKARVCVRWSPSQLLK